MSRQWSWLLVAILAGWPSELARAESACAVVTSSHLISATWQSVNGESVRPAEFSGGVQALILTNRTTSQEAVEASKGFQLEFGKQRFRQMLVIDGTGLAAFREFVLAAVRSDAPNKSGSPYIGIDFDGALVSELKKLTGKLLPDADPRQQAILLILDGQGKILSAHTLTDPLPAQLCVRQQLRALRKS